MKKNVFILIAILGLSAFSAGAGLIYYFVFTTKGSTHLAKYAISRYAKSQDITVAAAQGSLARGLSLRDIRVERLKSLPEGAWLQIQKLTVNLSSFGIGGINIELFNGALALSDASRVRFHGRMKNSILEFSLYSEFFSIQDAIGFFDAPRLAGITGRISDLDIKITGTLAQPRFNGGLQIERILRRGFSLVDCPLQVDLQGEKVGRADFGLSGEALLLKGAVRMRRTAVVNLKKSRIIFNGRADNPAFDVRANSLVEGVEIDITLKGTRDKPQLQLTSRPPLSQQRLMVMLLTGKSWKSAEDFLSTQAISLGLVKDFLDYFVFAGSGSKVASTLGLTDVIIKLDKDKTAVGVKKAITDKLHGSYVIEKFQLEEAAGQIEHKIGGEYKITDTLSVEAQKQIRQESEKSAQAEETLPADDKVILKYKVDF